MIDTKLDPREESRLWSLSLVNGRQGQCKLGEGQSLCAMRPTWVVSCVCSIGQEIVVGVEDWT
jgi:hypothetical protein